jgi:hypothetical protein
MLGADEVQEQAKRIIMLYKGLKDPSFVHTVHLFLGKAWCLVGLSKDTEIGFSHIVFI